LLAAFDFGEKLRQGAAETVASLRFAQLPVEILSGDRDDAVRTIAEALKVSYRPNMAPADKTARIRALENEGRKVLMVGDGVNDAPALVAAHVSMAPASAADIGRNAADLVFLHETLLAVPEAIRIARAAGHLVRQNLTLAVVYNAIALPVAVLGYVTPLVAAIAMSLSSVIVVANALRLRGGSSGNVPASVNQAQLASGHI
jgi:Cu2+-exporting ATPase